MGRIGEIACYFWRERLYLSLNSLQDDDDDDLGDVLEFADGTRYEVPQSATLPTEAETAAFEQAAQAEKEAAALAAEYRESLAREQSKGDASSGVPSPADKAERFVDDFDRGAKARAQEEQQPASAASRQPASGRTLFNDRLGRFEPAGRAPPAGRKDLKESKPLPPSVLQRPPRGALPPQDQARPPQRPLPSGQQPSKAGQAVKFPLSPSSTKAQAPVEVSQHKRADTAPRKSDSPWAKLPPVTQEPIVTEASTVANVVTQTGSTPASQSATSAPAEAQPTTPAVPASPVEDPEEAYKREMRSIADQARKRRQDEEAEREAQKERARKKAQELEEKMIASRKDTPVSTPTSAKPTPKTILSPLPSKSDRQMDWRKPSVDIKPAQESQKQSDSTQSERHSQNKHSQPIPVLTSAFGERKATSSSGPSQALANNAATTGPPSRMADAPYGVVNAEQPTRAQHRDNVPAASRSEETPATQSQARQWSAAAAEGDGATSPPTAAPRVRLGRRLSPRQVSENNSPAATPNASGVPHAFPQPTIMVGRHAKAQEAPFGSQPVSALDKIMSQVRAAQDDLKTRQAAAAMLEEEQRKLHSSSKEAFDGALDRISQALNQAAVQAKPRENVPIPVRMNPRVVEETFETTIPERPQSPRIWKTFNVKILSVLRSDIRDLPAWRIRAFEDPFFPPPIYSSSWIPHKGLRLPRNMSLEDYLFQNEDASAPPRVKVSKLYLTSADLPEVVPVPSNSNTISSLGKADKTVGQATTPSLVHTTSTADKASLDSDAFIRSAPANPDEEENIATVPFDEDDDDEDESAVIKVSLPKTLSPPSQDSARSAAHDAIMQEAGRFKTYGPRLPENSTVAFRRGISPSKVLNASEFSDKHMFMVNSELNGNKDDNLPSFMRSYDQQVVDEVSAPSRAFAAVSSTSRQHLRPSPPLEPVFPSLSPGAERNIDSAETGGQSSFSGMRREELPRHVIAELERLNATVSAVSSVLYLRSCPSSLH